MKRNSFSSNSSIKELTNKKKNGIIFQKNDFDFFISYLREKSANLYHLKYLNGLELGSLITALDIKGINEEEVTEFIKSILDSSKEFNALEKKEGYVLDYLNFNKSDDCLPLVLGPILSALNLNFVYIFTRNMNFFGNTFSALDSIGVTCNFSFKLNSIIKEESLIYLEQDKTIIDFFNFFLKNLIVADYGSIYLYLVLLLSYKFQIKNTILIINLPFGNSSFIKTINNARKIANQILNICNIFKKKAILFLTSSDNVIGKYIGSALQIKKVTNLFDNYKNWTDVVNVIKKMVSEICYRLNFIIDKQKVENMVEELFSSKKALSIFQRMCAKQRGASLIKYNNFRINRYFSPKFQYEIKALQDGYIDFKDYSLISYVANSINVSLNSSNKIDTQAGILFYKIAGDKVNKDEIIAIIYVSSKMDENLLELFSNNILYFDKRELITVKNYFQDAFDNLNLIKVVKNKDEIKN